MPQLAALYDEKGDWDVFVVEGLERGVLDPKRNTIDLLGRSLPDWVGARTLNGVKPSEGLRLALELKGRSKEKRQNFFEEQAQGQSLVYSGTQA